MTKKEILFESDEAAKPHTMQGWVSSENRFYADEAMARYDGCTHKTCACGRGVHEKHWTCCQLCRSEKDDLKFQQMPEVPFAQVDVCCLRSGETFFFDEQDLLDWCEDNSVDPWTVQLVVCEPSWPGEVDPDDFFEDILPEDTATEDASPEIAAAFQVLNDVISKNKKPFSWFPGKKRTSYPRP